MANKQLQGDTGAALKGDPQPQVRRILRWFDRTTDELVGSAPIHGIDVRALQRMFGVKPDNPMYDCYPVGLSQASQLQAYVDVPILLDKYDYAVEADAVASPVSATAP